MQTAGKNVPGVVVAGLSGGSGKTVISLGLVAALRQKGMKVSVFKKGPDYIDAGWLSKAAGLPCYNLDTFLCKKDVVQHSYQQHSQNSDISIVEGNRGLFDGIDTDGSTSTAELAKLLDLSVLLVLDCTKSTRTMAAILMGCQHFDPGVRIAGVILNRVAGARHENKVRSNIARFCQVPVLGAVPKLKKEAFPERHMGLVPSQEHQSGDEALTAAIQLASDYIDLDAIAQMLKEQHQNPEKAVAASKAAGNPSRSPSSPTRNREKRISSIDSLKNSGKDSGPGGQDNVTIGVVRDSAFQFYYPDNIEALKQLGATIVYISPLKEEKLPYVDAIYMGGGFPETHAPQLAMNTSFRNHLKELSNNGLPIYAECGGLIFLGESILLKDQEYPMSGILPIRFGLSPNPEGHGYTAVKVITENPFYEVGEVLKGHEFRYSKVLEIDYRDPDMAFLMERGKGIVGKKDGFFKNATFGTYTHIHALGTPSWAPSLIRKAVEYRAAQNTLTDV